VTNVPPTSGAQFEGRRAAKPAGVEPLDPIWGALRGKVSLRRDGLVEARASVERDADPQPLAAGDANAYREVGVRRTPRESFEALLAAIAPDRRAHFLQHSKESRGAWTLLLAARQGTALHLGSALSGSVIPLASLGLRTTLVDPSPERLSLGLALGEVQVPGRLRGVLAGDAAALPFEDEQFDVVVCDVDELSDALLAELARVARGEVFALADNRLGYKRSTGESFQFEVPGPLPYLRSALRPPHGERTLAGWRKAFERALGAPRAFALYPDRRDFAQVAALEAPLPRLFVGPNEARNRVKVAGHRFGLFPLLAPSFGLLARKRGSKAAPARIETLLDAVAEATGEPRPHAEHLIGTRGNTCVVMTAVDDADPSDARGRWVLHLPLHLPHRRGLEVHFRALERMRRDFPGFPVPEPLWMGEADGLWLTCERRLPGWASNHFLVDRASADPILEQMADHLAHLTVRATRTFSDEDFARAVEPLFDDTLRAVRDAALRGELARRRDEARRQLVGRALPLVFGHGDVRSKHVQVDASGRVLGYLDFGTVIEPTLPGLDLMHRIVHDRKQLEGTSDGTTSRELSDPQRLRIGERRALERYARNLSIEARSLQAVALVYPVFVGAVIERYSPFVRPDWFRHTFGI
jgi:SAM-dependent methyltransferase